MGKGNAARENEGKPRWGLVPQSALLPLVRVLEHGAQRYGAWNFTKGLSITEICESLKRHLDAFMEGQDTDSDSGLHHVGHIQANALFLSWMLQHRPEMDDRFIFKKENNDGSTHD